MKKKIKNMAASVQERLHMKTRQSGRAYDELLRYYAMERFLYRLGRSEYADHFILKGALLFTVWDVPQSRATRDIDLMSSLSRSSGKLAGIVKEICKTDVEDDGVTFVLETVKGEPIQTDEDYVGVRVKFLARLAQVRISMQIDVGFGDTIFPKPVKIEYPVLLDMPSPRLKGYPPETVVAEKFHVMVEHGMLNSRMKDFYDLCLLAERFDFSSKMLSESLKKTFAKRSTPITLEPVVFSGAFEANERKIIQWNVFLRRSELKHGPKDLEQAIERIKKFLIPVIKECIGDSDKSLHWKAPGPWKPEK